MTTLRIDLSDLKELKLSLERLQSKVSDLSPVMRQVGAKLLDTTLERFDTMSGPDGREWKPLSRQWSKRKRNVGKILTESGNLRDSIDFEVAGRTLYIGSSLKYASPHQFGGEIEIPGRTQTNWHRTKGPKKGQFVSGRAKLKSKLAKVAQIPPHKVRIPARPFLGLSDEDKELVQEIVQRHLERAMKDALRS